MKALTVCQPYAELFMLPANDPRVKRVENRTWYTRHRGLTYLHAGKSRAWLSDVVDGIEQAYKLPVKPMAFGAIVATAELIDCLHIAEINRGKYDEKYPWLRDHQHTNGPYCWIFSNVTPIGPWPWKGAQGLFEIDEAELDRVANEQLGIATP